MELGGRPPGSTTVTTLVEGDGDAVADGDTVSTYLYVGNGSTQKDLYSDYDNGSPEAIPNTEQAGEVFRALFTGATYGSRVAAVTTAKALFGESVEGNQLGIGVDDTVVLVADIMEKQQESPTPTDDKAHDASPDTMPSVVEKDGTPTGLDFSGIDEPALDTPVQRVVLEQGTGAAVKASDTVKINYLGATYDAKQPFDESFSKQPLTSALTGLIQGWTIGLTGVKVGSRVLIQIPPAYGYGAQGSGAIPANATLWSSSTCSRSSRTGHCPRRRCPRPGGSASWPATSTAAGSRPTTACGAGASPSPARRAGTASSGPRRP